MGKIAAEAKGKGENKMAGKVISVLGVLLALSLIHIYAYVHR